MVQPRPAPILLFLSFLVRPLQAAPPPEALPAAEDVPSGEKASTAENEVAGPSKDGRHTSGQFAKNLGRNAIGLFSNDNLLPFAVTMAATGTSALFDDDVHDYFKDQRRAKGLGDFVWVEGQPYVVVPIAAILYGAGRLTSHEHQGFRDATYDVAQATIVEAVFMTSLKYATQRPRPDGSNRLSFPSGHTCNAFAWATVAARHFGPKAAIPSYLFAAFVGIGRMERNNHYLSDVVAGAGLGYLVGRSVTKRDKERLPDEKRFSFEPVIPPGGGLGVRASLEF